VCGRARSLKTAVSLGTMSADAYPDPESRTAT
jgi:hypothetical protein